MEMTDQSLAEQVKQLEHKCSRLENLVSEIIATLIIDANREWFESLPEQWHSLVQQWTDIYMSIKREG